MEDTPATPLPVSSARLPIALADTLVSFWQTVELDYNAGVVQHTAVHLRSLNHLAGEVLEETLSDVSLELLPPVVGVAPNKNSALRTRSREGRRVLARTRVSSIVKIRRQSQ
jgi:hypothetical protein